MGKEEGRVTFSANDRTAFLFARVGMRATISEDGVRRWSSRQTKKAAFRRPSTTTGSASQACDRKVKPASDDLEDFKPDERGTP